jgi:hypothetical protein
VFGQLQVRCCLRCLVLLLVVKPFKLVGGHARLRQLVARLQPGM